MVAGESMLDSGDPAETEARVRYLLALSQLQLGRSDRARPHLDAARAHYEAVEDAEKIVECMATEISDASLRESPDAVQIGKRALAACRELQPVPVMLEVRILNMLASAYILAFAWADAIEALERALELVGPLFDLKRQARLFIDLGIAYKEIGRFEPAIRYTTRAVALFEMTREPNMLAMAENNLGYILLCTGDVPSARLHLEHSLALYDETGYEFSRSRLFLSLCELSLAEGQIGAARDWADRALEMSTRRGERSQVAETHMWLGTIAAECGDAAACDEHFGEAVRGWNATGAVEWQVRCHERYAELLEKRGDLAGANEQLKMALGVRSHPPVNVLPVD